MSAQEALNSARLQRDVLESEREGLRKALARVPALPDLPYCLRWPAPSHSLVFSPSRALSPSSEFPKPPIASWVPSWWAQACPAWPLATPASPCISWGYPTTSGCSLRTQGASAHLRGLATLSCPELPPLLAPQLRLGRRSACRSEVSSEWLRCPSIGRVQQH